MCGIAGIVRFDGHAADAKSLAAMAGTLAHRGPDGEGFHVDGNVGLAHRRLAIIDPSGGHQPLSNRDGTLWITYNGEIYNFRELRTELESRGHVFRARSDTEVAVHAYEEWGEKCLDRFRGMFAFAVWDARKRQLFLARDRLGVKPLYYHHGPRLFAFASEAKAILALEDVPRDVDPGSVIDYLAYGYVPQPASIWKGILKLPPGHCLTIPMHPGDGAPAASPRRYWSLEFRPDHGRSEYEWREALIHKIDESVRLRLVSDVPFGAFLSGGVDSSAVVASMSGQLTEPVRTFSIGFKEEAWSELPYARQVAYRYTTRHHEEVVEPEAIELLPKLAWAYDEPFGDSSAIPTYCVSRLAARHVKMVLSGDGGDESFCGYPRYIEAMQEDLLTSRLPLWIRRTLVAPLARRYPPRLRGYGRLQRLARDQVRRYHQRMGLPTYDEARRYLRPEYTSLVDERQESSFFVQNYPDSRPWPLVSKLQYLDLATYLPEDILVKVDRASMLCSLEAREPLLDHELVELAATIPPELLLRNGEGKWIFKRAHEARLPREILSRPKMGFGVPLQIWFREDLRDFIRDTLLAPDAVSREFFRPRALEALVDQQQAGSRDRTPSLWLFLAFETWGRVYLRSRSEAVA